MTAANFGKSEKKVVETFIESLSFCGGEQEVNAMYEQEVNAI